MLIKKRTIIYTPFKNYSSSLIAYFGNLGWNNLPTLHPQITGDLWNNGPWYQQCGLHGNVVPNRFQSFKKILPIRNPYERLISAWRFHLKTIPSQDNMTFDQYLEINGRSPAAFPVSRFFSHDAIVRVEHLVEDFAALGYEINNFPHKNKSDSQNFRDCLNQRQKEIIQWWHKEDFDAGGYER